MRLGFAVVALVGTGCESAAGKSDSGADTSCEPCLADWDFATVFVEEGDGSAGGAGWLSAGAVLEVRSEGLWTPGTISLELDYSHVVVGEYLVEVIDQCAEYAAAGSVEVGGELTDCAGDCGDTCGCGQLTFSFREVQFPSGGVLSADLTATVSEGR
jgi:hypothetical protein